MCLVARHRALGFSTAVSSSRVFAKVRGPGLLATLVVAGGLALPRPAAAQEYVTGTAYRLRLDLDLPIVLVGGAVASSFFFMDEAPGVACMTECDRSRLNAIDRPAAGNYDPQWSKVGNIATAATMLAPIVVLTVDRGFGRGLMQKMKLDDAVKDVTASLNEVKSAGKVGIVGYCWGGTCSFKSACSVNGLAAAVAYYGGGIPGLIGEKPKCPVMFHWGETDASIPLDKAKEVAAAHKDQIHYFYPAGHGFNCDERGSYHAESAKLARGRTL